MNMRTHAAFHKALQRHASRQIDDFDVVLFQIYLSMYVPIIISLQNVLTKFCKNKLVQFFLPHSVDWSVWSDSDSETLYWIRQICYITN